MLVNGGLVVLSVVVSSVVVMYLSICCCVRWAVKSTPPLVLIPYCPCWVRKGSISLLVRVKAIVAAVRRSAVPIPIGRSLFKLFMSLWRAKKCMDENRGLIGGGIWLLR